MSSIEEKTPYMIVIGDKEKNLKSLAVRERKSRKVVKTTVKKFIDKIKKEISQKK